MPELVLNVHMHTTYSDGSGTHAQIAKAAIQAGLDAIIVTDHDVYVGGLDGYHEGNGKRVLLLVGEEVHDPVRQPQKNHLLVFGAGRELCTYAADPQRLIDQVLKADAICFLAHPYENALPQFGEDEFSWVDWNVHGFTGLELWNGASEFKNVVHSYLDAIFYAFFPKYIARGPLPLTVKKWDGLNNQGNRVVGICGADAHMFAKRLGPLRRDVFPYEFHFRSINNHVLVPKPLSGSVIVDRQMIIEALRQGHSFIGYDLPASTRGFSFTAKGRDTSAMMGDEIKVGDGITLQVRLPEVAECRLIRDGVPVKAWHDRETSIQTVNQTGVYRVECYIHYLGRRRAWIISNPIYVRR